MKTSIFLILTHLLVSALHSQFSLVGSCHSSLFQPLSSRSSLPMSLPLFYQLSLLTTSTSRFGTGKMNTLRFPKVTYCITPPYPYCVTPPYPYCITPPYPNCVTPPYPYCGIPVSHTVLHQYSHHTPNVVYRHIPTVLPLHTPTVVHHHTPTVLTAMLNLLHSLVLLAYDEPCHIPVSKECCLYGPLPQSLTEEPNRRDI